MSVKITSWVWHGEPTAHLKGNEAMVLLALADIADDDGRVVYAREGARTQAALAKKARVSVATFRRTTKALAESGLLSIERASQRSENQYQILMTAQSGRSQMSGQDAQFERSERSLGERSSGGTPIQGRTYVRDVTTSDVACDVLPTYPTEVYHLCNVLADAVRANGHTVGTVGKTWWSSCDRLLRLDGYSIEQIDWMIRWATSHEFWATNIRSMPTLREKFSTLKAQAMRDASKRQSSPTERAHSVIEMGRRLAAEVAS